MLDSLCMWVSAYSRFIFFVLMIVFVGIYWAEYKRLLKRYERLEARLEREQARRHFYDIR